MERQERKPTRLGGYDYSHDGAYFVTICTKDRKCVLSRIETVGEGLCALPSVKLTPIGEIVEASIGYLNSSVEGFTVEKYVIMPNHIHLLVRIFETGGHRGPPLHKVIGQFKSYTTHRYRKVLWQRSFHDHVIRGEEDYLDIWRYVDENPYQWQEDCFYIPDASSPIPRRYL